jgi:catechol 2,3-dioxygenase-like lactoylglutathione lyase family enzyme
MGSAERGQSGNETLYTRMVPILFMTDVAAERDFYVKLGFRVSYEGPEYPDFIALAYGSLEFGIEQSSQFGMEYPNRVLTWQLGVGDVDAAKERLTEAEIEFREEWMTPREDWRYRVLHCTTPNNYHLMLEGPNE